MRLSPIPLWSTPIRHVGGVSSRHYFLKIISCNCSPAHRLSPQKKYIFFQNMLCALSYCLFDQRISRTTENFFLELENYGSNIAPNVGSRGGSTPWAIGDRGLNVSTEVSTRTPRFHQPHLLWELSSSPILLSPIVAYVRKFGLEWLPFFRRGFRLRCFQPLSSIAWLPGSTLSDNR